MNSPMSCPGLLGILSMVSKMSIRSELTFFSFPPFTGAKPLMGASRLQACHHSQPLDAQIGQVIRVQAAKGMCIMLCILLHGPPCWHCTLLTRQTFCCPSHLYATSEHKLQSFGKVLAGLKQTGEITKHSPCTIHICTRYADEGMQCGQEPATVHAPSAYGPDMQMKAWPVDKSQLCRHPAD